MKKLLVIGLSIITMLSMLLIGCQRPSIQTATTLVPEKANAIAKVKIAQILNDEDIADLYACIAAMDPYAPQTLRLALDELRDETGVDFRYFNEAVLFADLATIEATIPYVGGIVECNIPAKQVFEAFERLGVKEHEVYTYSGYKIYSLEDDISIAFLSSKLVAVGPSNVVEDVIDVGLGKSKPMSGEIYDLYDGLGDPLVKLAFGIPSELKREIPETFEESGFVVNLLPLRDISIVSCALDKGGEIITAKAELHFTNTLSAETTEELIKDFITLSKYIWPSPEIKDALQKVQVTTYDSQVLVSLDMTLAEIKDLINALEMYL